MDVSTLLPYFITALLVCIGIANLFKFTAAKYLYPLGFEAEEQGPAVIKKPLHMDSSTNACAICQEPGPKRCSRCKTARYCSLECQTKHWNQGHKLDCKATRDSAVVDSKNNSCNSSNGFGTCKKNDSLEKASDTGVPLAASSGGTNGILAEPKKVLFSYEIFAELFSWNKLRMPPCGLINCGNSCFANVVLQCLTYTRPLVAYLLESNHSDTCGRNDWCFLCELQHHVRRVKQSEEPFSPLGILSHIPKMSGSLGYGRQEDAHEFMRVAIDSMQSICLDEVGGEKAVDPDTRETTLIYYIFGGHLQSQVKCTQCYRVSNRYENMMDLNVEIQGDVASLEDALEQFTAFEWLDGENRYKCDGCDAYVKALKRLTVHQAPNILTIALKRFQTGRFGKLNKRVTFPETLDLSPYVSGKGNGLLIYKLYAVVVHVDMLNASFFGHYVCYVKDLHGSWYRIDDFKVKRVDLEDVLSERAYMLLYSRVSVRPPSAVADSPTSAVKKVAKYDFNHSTSLVHNQSHFTSCRTDGYLSSPFEVVEPLRSNLGNGQEAAIEKIEILGNLRSSDELRNTQESDLATRSLSSCDVDMVPVDVTSEGSGLLTGNSSCSEESSTKAGERSLNTVHFPLSQPKPLNTCLNRSTSCPSLVAMKPSLPVNNINERAISFDPLAGLVFFPHNRLDNGDCSCSASKHSYLDTPRISDLTESDTSRISTIQNCDLDVVGPEKMDCGYEVAQLSAENSSDNFHGFLNDYAINGIVDNSSQCIPPTMNISPFSCDNGEDSPNSSVHACLPTVTYENQHGTVLNYRDSCGQAGKIDNISEADMMEKDNDVGDEPHKPVGSSSRQAMMNDSHPGMPGIAAQSSVAEPRTLNNDKDFVDSQINLALATDNDVMSCESTRDADEFPIEDGMVEGLADSTSELRSFEHQHLKERSDTCQNEQNGCLENTQGAMLEGSASTNELSAGQLDSAKIVTTHGNGKPISTQAKKAVKPKTMFTPGFLNRPSSLSPVTGSISSQDGKNHSFTSSEECTSRKDSYLHGDDAKLATSTSAQFDVDSRTHLDVSSHEHSCILLDGSKVVTSVVTELDMGPKAETIASVSCEAGKRQTGSTIKPKPLFARGFLDRRTRSQHVTQSKAPQKNDCNANGFTAVHKTAVGDGVSGVGQFDANGGKSILGQSGMLVGQNQSAEKNGLESSPSNEKEVTSNVRKRALSSESLHTEPGSSVTLNANGKMAVTGQKQGRNDSCSCGSQRKWKKCCGRPDVLRNLSAR